MYILNGEIVSSEMTKNAHGGTELMAERLVKHVPAEALEPFQIFLSRKTDDFVDGKLPILWTHDTAWDPAAKEALGEGKWQQWHKIVFVSHTQREQFMLVYGIPHSKTMVLPNFIDPIEPGERSGKIKLAYWSTPHRGLDIAYSVFRWLKNERGLDIEFKVFSSFGLYGWEERDKEFTALFDALKEDEAVEYIPVLSNEVLRDRIKEFDILAYPSTWPETSCLVLIEAMSAGLLAVHSDLGALPETAKGMTFMYPFTEDKEIHAKRFAAALNAAIEVVRSNQMQDRLQLAKVVADYNHSTENVSQLWNGWLSQPDTRTKEVQLYRVG